MNPEYLEITIAIGGALLAGSLIGLERAYHGRPAGFRTHALVCTSSAILMLVTAYQWMWLDGVPLETIRTDPTRMAQGIMTGVGFYFPAVLSTVIVLGILALFRRLEDHIPSQLYAHTVLRFARAKVPSETELRRLLDEHGFSVRDISYALIAGGAEFEYRSVIVTRKMANMERLVERLRSMDDLLEFRLSPTGD